MCAKDISTTLFFTRRLKLLTLRSTLEKSIRASLCNMSFHSKHDLKNISGNILVASRIPLCILKLSKNLAPVLSKECIRMFGLYVNIVLYLLLILVCSAFHWKLDTLFILFKMILLSRTKTTKLSYKRPT